MKQSFFLCYCDANYEHSDWGNSGRNPCCCIHRFACLNHHSMIECYNDDLFSHKGKLDVFLHYTNIWSVLICSIKFPKKLFNQKTCIPWKYLAILYLLWYNKLIMHFTWSYDDVLRFCDNRPEVMYLMRGTVTVLWRFVSRGIDMKSPYFSILMKELLVDLTSIQKQKSFLKPCDILPNAEVLW